MTTPLRRKGYQEALRNLDVAKAALADALAEYDTDADDPHVLDRRVGQINWLRSIVESAERAVAFWKTMGGDR